jgi:N-acetylglutamate synthase-like GNAT family acetyltransferase
MDIKPYQPRDRAACLDVFRSLTPALLEPSALPIFESWLDSAAGPYFVMEQEDSVVGCGGYSLSPDRTIATLQWGMVRNSSQRMGLGRFLLMYRIREIGKEGTVGIVLAHPPKPSAGFFQKQGFRADGSDGALIRKLTVCP